MKRKLKVKLILPALTEATSPYWRPVKYSLFPPLGLATLAGYLDDEDEMAYDCIIVIVHNGGEPQQPICVPTTCSGDVIEP